MPRFSQQSTGWCMLNLSPELQPPALAINRLCTPFTFPTGLSAFLQTHSTSRFPMIYLDLQARCLEPPSPPLSCQVLSFLSQSSSSPRPLLVHPLLHRPSHHVMRPLVMGSVQQPQLDMAAPDVLTGRHGSGGSGRVVSHGKGCSGDTPLTTDQLATSCSQGYFEQVTNTL